MAVLVSLLMNPISKSLLNAQPMFMCHLLPIMSVLVVLIARLRETYPFPGIKLTFVSEIPMHCGFGSGTQLALGIAQAANVLYELGLDVQELATAVGRGGTSGIGVAAFDAGGFIVDGGHRFPEQKASFLPSSAVGDIPPPANFAPLLVSRSATVNCCTELLADLWR